MPGHRFVALVLLVGSMVAGLSAPGAAGAALRPPGGVVLQPADGAGNPINNPGYFDLNAAPGTSTQLHALVGNITSKKVSISVVPVDASSGVYGGVSYNLPQQPRRGVGAWIRQSAGRVRVASGQAALIALTVHVPSGTRPGQYVGGLTAFVPIQRARGGTRRRGAIQVQVRRVVAIVVTVPGPRYGRFGVQTVTAQGRPDAYYVIAHLRNTGTMLLAAQGNLWVWRFGQRKAIIAAHLTIGTTVPHTDINYPVHWARRPPPGTYHFHIVVWWRGGKVVRSGNFVV